MLPPMTAAQRWIPSTSASRAWLFTQSFTVIMGKSGPQGWPVSGLMDAGAGRAVAAAQVVQAHYEEAVRVDDLAGGRYRYPTSPGVLSSGR